jgi:hypothetical protein
MKNIIIASLIVGLAIYGVAMYSKNRQLNRDIDTIINVASEEMNTQAVIDTCMNNAYDTYLVNWNTACSSLGLGANCSLPTYRSDRIDQIYKEAQDMCITRYK